MKKHIASLLLFFLLLIGTGTAQMMYYPYYGKNKIMYESFSWDHYKTDHFDIYFYRGDMKALKRIADMAESAYSRVSQAMKHQLSTDVPMIFYQTFTDFEQTNLIQVPEGVLGFAEPILYRFVVRGDMSDDELYELIEHELTHVFQYDILYGGPGAALYAIRQPPGWAMEGYAEYNTRRWSTWSKLIVRDAVLTDRIPQMTETGQLFSQYPLPRPPDYDFGHAIFEFIEASYGKNAIREFWHSMQNFPMFRRSDPVKKTFGKTPKEFNFEFKKYMRERFKPFLMRENPEDYSINIGPEFPMNGYYFSFSHALSPSGDLVAAITYNVRAMDIDVVMISTKDGKPVKNITKGYTTKYDYLKYEVNADRGKNVAWSPDGDRIAFIGRSGRRYPIYLANVLTGKTERKFPLPVDQPAGLAFHPNGKEILFTGFVNGIPDIFKLNLETEEVTNLTKDDLYEKAPVVSPDGSKVAYTVRIDVFDKIFISPIDNFKQKKQITFGRGNTISPEYSPDGTKLYFSGDMREAYNIYSTDLNSGKMVRYTDVRTGNFFPTPMAGEPGKIVFSSFNKGAYQLFAGTFEGTVEKTVSFVDVPDEKEFQKFEPILTLEIKKDEIKPYKGMGKLYMMGRPPIETIVSTDGSIYGGSALAFSDLMGDHTFSLMAYQVRSFRSYYASYINQKSRLQWAASAFSYSIYYYPQYAYYDPTLYNYLSYQDAIAVRHIAGANLAGFYPLNVYYRAEFGLSYTNYEEDFYDPYINQQLYAGGNSYGRFLNGNILSASAAIVGETTTFGYYGPKSGHTFRVGVNQAIPIISGFLSNTSIDVDLRKYLYIGGDFLFAARLKGFASRGKNPYVYYWGGNNEVRSSYYYNIIGTEGWYANLEFRFPLINQANTLIGQIGPVRGTIFLDISRSKVKGFPAKFYRYEEGGDPLFPTLIEFDALGSWGYGFEFFFLGLPLHLDFVKRLEFPKITTPFDYNVFGGFQTKFWIGFDF
jgi:hypothetical protein